eukprot:gene11246-15090_t
MGCSQSKDLPNDLDSRLEEEINKEKEKSEEKQNLLRFKIEVLVQMLAIEEKKNESLTKRVETLKWILLAQGVSEQHLASLLINSNSIESIPLQNNKLLMDHQDNSISVPSSNNDRSILIKNIGMIDLNGPISRMISEFDEYPDSIIEAFADSNGKILTNINSDEFMRILFSITEKISKADIQVLSLRFGDGFGSVNIPEFLEFFTTPVQIRTAKSAISAVRMSLEYLQMEMDNYDENGDLIDINGPHAIQHVIKSHKTDQLDESIKKMLLLWEFVAIELEEAFKIMVQKNDEQESSIIMKGNIDIEQFKKILIDICGEKSKVLNQAEVDKKIILNHNNMKNDRKIIKNDLKSEPKQSKTDNNSKHNNNKDTPTSSDSKNIDDKFELANEIDYFQFLSYFNELFSSFKKALLKKQKVKNNDKIDKNHNINNNVDMTASKDDFTPSYISSPFRLSSEWNTLKTNSLLRKSNQYLPVKPPPPALSEVNNNNNINKNNNNINNNNNNNKRDNNNVNDKNNDTDNINDNNNDETEGADVAMNDKLLIEEYNQFSNPMRGANGSLHQKRPSLSKPIDLSKLTEEELLPQNNDATKPPVDSTSQSLQNDDNKLKKNSLDVKEEKTEPETKPNETAIPPKTDPPDNAKSPPIVGSGGCCGRGQAPPQSTIENLADSKSIKNNIKDEKQDKNNIDVKEDVKMTHDAKFNISESNSERHPSSGGSLTIDPMLHMRNMTVADSKNDGNSSGSENDDKINVKVDKGFQTPKSIIKKPVMNSTTGKHDPFIPLRGELTLPNNKDDNKDDNENSTGKGINRFKKRSNGNRTYE